MLEGFTKSSSFKSSVTAKGKLIVLSVTMSQTMLSRPHGPGPHGRDNSHKTDRNSHGVLSCL